MLENTLPRGRDFPTGRLRVPPRQPPLCLPGPGAASPTSTRVRPIPTSPSLAKTLAVSAALADRGRPCEVGLMLPPPQTRTLDAESPPPGRAQGGGSA